MERDWGEQGVREYDSRAPKYDAPAYERRAAMIHLLVPSYANRNFLTYSRQSSMQKRGALMDWYPCPTRSKVHM